MQIASDGLVRLSIDELLSTTLEHLISGLDMESDSPNILCGRRTTISGFTEWVTRTTPFITLGWDWGVDVGCGGYRWIRLGWPRTNVLLIDEYGQDKPWQKSLEHLATIVDALPWRDRLSERCSQLLLPRYPNLPLVL